MLRAQGEKLADGVYVNASKQLVLTIASARLFARVCDSGEATANRERVLALLGGLDAAAFAESKEHSEEASLVVAETAREKRLGDLLVEQRQRANRLDEERAAAVERAKLLEENAKATSKKRRAQPLGLPDDDEHTRSLLRMHDADQGAMLARHGLRLAFPMPHGRWRCGCGFRGGNRAYVLECADPFRASSCRRIECKCGGFKCDKTDLATLEAHFNEVCGFFDEGTGLSQRRLKLRAATAAPPAKPLLLDTEEQFVARVLVWMNGAAAVMRRAYATHAACYEAVLRECPWRGVLAVRDTGARAFFGANGAPPPLVDAPPWPFAHPGFPRPHGWWGTSVRRPVSPGVVALLRDHSMRRPEGWGAIAADQFLQPPSLLCEVGDDARWVIVRDARDWMARAASVMKRPYATHADCSAAVRALGAPEATRWVVVLLFCPVCVGGDMRCFVFAAVCRGRFATPRTPRRRRYRSLPVVVLL